MLKLLGIFTSLCLILIIFFRNPKESTGLASFATKSNLLGSARSAERILNIFTMVGIIAYLTIAFQLNLLNNQV